MKASAAFSSIVVRGVEGLHGAGYALVGQFDPLAVDYLREVPGSCGTKGNHRGPTGVRAKSWAAQRSNVFIRAVCNSIRPIAGIPFVVVEFVGHRPGNCFQGCLRGFLIVRGRQVDEDFPRLSRTDGGGRADRCNQYGFWSCDVIDKGADVRPGSVQFPVACRGGRFVMNRGVLASGMRRKYSMVNSWAGQKGYRPELSQERRNSRAVPVLRAAAYLA